MNIDIRQLKYLHPKLRQILTWLEKDTGLTFTITSQYRIEDNGVHGSMPLRAHDLRCPVAPIGKVIEKHINNNWIYDPDRPRLKVCLFHGPPNHLHIQVHPKTARRQ